ncbi:MAG TPA: cell wall-binding repeat-containing protein [Euzebya sp.]|nr:cell wall-binding repeat-containing protein [Euzebya sp.]
MGDVMVQRSGTTLVIAALLVLGLVQAAVAQTVASSDTILIVKADEQPSNADIAVRVSAATFDTAATVLIGRDDVFADSMASGLLQGAEGAPLLLTPPSGPLSADAVDQITQLGATNAIVLGGEAAVAPSVADDLAAMGLAVLRFQGPTRLETATDIAGQYAADADTAILTRAFADEAAADPSQAWADALAVGGWSAETGWPILLTETDRLSTSTAAFLESSDIGNVELVGGTAAISAEVEQQLVDMGMAVTRTAGADRFETAIEVAAKRGASSAAEAASLVIAEGSSDPDAWVTAFTTAAASGAERAPIVLVNGDQIPAATEAWLTGEPSFAQADLEPGVRLLCVFYVASLCPQVRALLDLPAAMVAAEPAAGAELTPGQTIEITVTPVRGEVTDVTAEGCGADAVLSPDGGTVTVGEASGPDCDLVITVSFAAPTEAPVPNQRFTFGYLVASG